MVVGQCLRWELLVIVYLSGIRYGPRTVADLLLGIRHRPLTDALETYCYYLNPIAHPHSLSFEPCNILISL